MSIERRHKPACCCPGTHSLFPVVRKTKKGTSRQRGKLPWLLQWTGLCSRPGVRTTHHSLLVGHSHSSAFAHPGPSFWTTSPPPFKSNSSWAIPSPLLPGRPFLGSAHHDYSSSLCPLAPTAGPMCPTQPSMYMNTVLGLGRVGSTPRISQKKKKRKKKKKETREAWFPSELGEIGSCMAGRAAWDIFPPKSSACVTLG